MKFKPLDDVDISDSDDGGTGMKPQTPTDIKGNVVEHLPSSNSSSSGTTLKRDSGKHSSTSERGMEGEVPEYSDHEENAMEKNDYAHHESGWTPEFLRRHRRNSVDSSVALAAENCASPQAAAPPPPSPLSAVPATPSLIKALDRIAIAQQTAFRTVGSTSESGTAIPVLSSLRPSTIARIPLKKRVEYNGFEWDTFWKDINAKTGG